MKKRKIIILIFVLIILVISVYKILYHFNIIEHKKYTNADFNIEPYTSLNDKDNDLIDDQSDILNNALEYVNKRPKYKSKYYETGYSNDTYGVCTDVVSYALLNSGYDLMNLVDEHIKENNNLYDIEIIDKNIDFRRVKNLYIYFENTAEKLTNDIYDIEEWQGGDIVVFEKHIGIVSNSRNKNGVAFVIHHAYPYQLRYEEDILENRNDIIGHYRIK